MRYILNFDTLKLPEEKAQIVVCGSGVAGLTTAIVLKEIGLNPVILTRGVGNTPYSQGGIASAVLENDSPKQHFLDTLRAGRLLNDEEALWVLVSEGPLRIADLERWGVNFDKEDGKFLTTTEGGHSRRRVLKVKDFTGKEIHTKLERRAKDLHIPFVQGELQEILGDGKVEGIIYADPEGRLRFIRTTIIVLATGGASSIFLYTSNHEKVRGDAIAIAFRAGAILKNPEFVQFHPTVVKGTNFLISEAVRGEGAHLVDERGERFVNELEPRDVVARAIYRKILSGSKVFLDFRPLVEKGVRIEDRFPTIFKFLTDKGINPYSEPVEIHPASHYYIGGIAVDTFGRTSLKGLYAVGECSCTGVHGANRLASNSLLEGVVFGYRTAYGIALDLPRLKSSDAHFKNPKPLVESADLSIKELRKLLWEKAGLEREGKSLQEAKEFIESKLAKFYGKAVSPELRSKIDIFLISLLTVEGALRREESRGVHYRKDFPYEREIFRRDTILGKDDVFVLKSSA